VWQFVGGPGIGRYMYNANNTPFVFFKPGSNDLDSITMYGAHAGYTHVWNKAFRSNLVAAYSWFTDPKIGGVAATNAMQKEFYQAFLNTFWSVSKTAELGLEYDWGIWKSFNGGGTDQLIGRQNRITATMHYNFY
jgi:hypothetical protein